jgi:glycosyltransferase involved in cell wall biosynthesis
MNPAPPAWAGFLAENGIPYHFLRYRGKADVPRAIASLYALFRKEKPHIVNTNLFDASFSGQVAAWLARVPVRIHSRHYASQHLVYFRNALKYDRLMNRISTHICVASSMVKNLMVEKECVPARKIRVIPYGFRMDSFRSVEQSRVDALAGKYFGGRRPWPVVGVVSRYLELKGLQYIIPAFGRLLGRYPGARLVLANAKGPYAAEVNRLLDGLPAGSFVTIPFEPDIAALYRLFDVFVHAPVDGHSEAFGQIYIEAPVSGVPSVFTLSGIAHDAIRHEVNALVADYCSADSIFESVCRILDDPVLAARLRLHGAELAGPFAFDRMAADTEAWYRELMAQEP